MIYSNITAKHSNGAYSAQVMRAIEYCGKTDFSQMKDGRYPIDDDFIVQVNERTTKPKEQNFPEVHKEFVDFQFMYQGKDFIGFYPDEANNEIAENHLEEFDTIFYKENPEVTEQMLPMHEGDFAVFFPEDVHRPLCQMDGPEDIKIIVIKIRVSSL